MKDNSAVYIHKNTCSHGFSGSLLFIWNCFLIKNNLLILGLRKQIYSNGIFSNTL